MQPDMKQTWSSSTIDPPPVWLEHGQMAPLGNQIGKALCPQRKVGGKTGTGPQLLCWRLWRGDDSEGAETVGLEIHNSQAQAVKLASLKREGCCGWDAVKGQLVPRTILHLRFTHNARHSP